MKKLLALVSGLVVLFLSTGPGGAQQRPAIEKSAQNMCLDTKTRLLTQIRTAEACAEEADKNGRVNDAENCWEPFPGNTQLSDRGRAEVFAESECVPRGARGEVVAESQRAPVDPGGGSVGLKISCYHAGSLVWCCGGGRCCDSAYGGYGCWSQ